MTKSIFVCALCATLVVLPSVSHAGTLRFDGQSSSVIFKVRQLAGQVVGGFRKFNGTLEADGTQVRRVEVAISTASVFTRQLQRDWDLLGPDLFDSAQFPKATFVSKQVSGDSVSGDLTFRGKTKPVTLKVTALPVEPGQPAGTIAFSIEGKISRKDFGLTYNRKMDDGKTLLADEVEIRAVVRATP